MSVIGQLFQFSPPGNMNSREKMNNGKGVLSLGEQEVAAFDPPIMSSYNDEIRPLLDVVDRLRHLNIMQEGIQLPTIVVVGDQSSGKSSVLESLAQISLPRGHGICTRVPLIMRLQNHENPTPELYLEYDGKIVKSDEDHISDAIVKATNDIAGINKGISINPLTLTVKRKGVPDLTLVDLPGIARVPVRDQPENIYEQISETIMEYIKPEESIILNVLSASVDFATCESIRMSQQVDKIGARTLAVVTKADKSPEGLMENVTADDVKMVLGYVCVRNRIGDESYEEAREQEAILFNSHPLLSRISKSMVGIPVLSQKLMQIQAKIILKCMPDIVRKIDSRLAANTDDLNKLPLKLTSVSDATKAFIQVIGRAQESLRKILERGEFDEYPDVTDMHCTTRLEEKLIKYSAQIHSHTPHDYSNGKFLIDEINVLEGKKTIWLPHFFSKTTFSLLLHKKVDTLASEPSAFVEETWKYIKKVIVNVLMRHSDNYPQLLSSTIRAAENLANKRMIQSIDWVNDIVKMEKLTAYTCNDPEYKDLYEKYISSKSQFIEAVMNESKDSKIQIEAFGEIDVKHLRNNDGNLEEAFDIKMRMTAYWKIVLMRLVDGMALHLRFTIHNLLDDMHTKIYEEVMGPEENGFEKFLEESPDLAEKRKSLTKTNDLLKKSRDELGKIKDRVGTRDS